jgi:hypothetical protein
MISYFISIQTKVRIKQEVHDIEYHVKQEVDETNIRFKLELEHQVKLEVEEAKFRVKLEEDHLLKLKSSEFLESRKAKQVLIEAFMGKLYTSK